MERLMDRLPPIFAALGLIGLATAVGLYLAGDGLDRYMPPVLAASVALLVYYAIERPDAVLGLARGRTLKYGGNTLAMSLAFIAILALLNVLAARFTYRVDLTEAKEFTLSPQTVKILTELQQPVKIVAFFREGQGKEELEDTLKEFARHTRQIETEFVDPDLKPGLARQYQIEFAGTVVMEAGDKRQTVMGTTEGDLISGIIKVTRGEPRKLYVLVGHGEPDPEGFDQTGFSSAKQALEAENYRVEPLNLVSAGKVPEDASLVVLAGPTKPLLPQEVQAFTDYLDQGGKALILADPNRMAGLPEIADRYDVEIAKGVAVDVGQSLPNDPLVPVVFGRGYLYSPITKNMPTMTVFPTITMVRPKKTDAAGKYQVTSLAQTTERSWLETDLSGQRMTMDPGVDTPGPLPIAVSAISTEAGPQPASEAAPRASTRLVVVGDVDFATNAVLNLEGNRDLLVNSVNWLAEEEDLISVRAKAPADRRVVLTGGQMNLVLYSTVILMPLAVLGFGAWVVWGRRGSK